jgi:sugar (pentulose or hexulose) kinase
VGEAGDVADVSGTVTSVRILSGSQLPADEHRLFMQPAVTDGLYVLGGSNNLGGGLIEWLKQGFYGGESLPYDLIEAEGEASELGARGVLFLPYLLGERCPVWDPDARGVFFGLERQHQRGDFARAVCESAAFGVEHILRVARGHGLDLVRLRVSGGLARLNLVNTIKADVTGLPTEVVEEFETTAVGAFLIAGAAAGTFGSLAEAASTVTVREIILPNKKRGERYAEWFELYLRLYDSLRDLFRDRQLLYQKQAMGGVGRLENL